MFAIQILLPLTSNRGDPFPRQNFDAVSDALTERFGGVTAYLRAPAAGSWQDEKGAIKYDDIVIYEALADSLDRDWWTTYRQSLERTFRQKEIVIHAHEVWKL